MTAAPSVPFEYPESLRKYVITEREYFEQNPQYQHVCSGNVVFNAEGKLLLVQRAKEEHAFPNAWEIPGGKVDSDDVSLLHAVARELKEETGIDVTRFVRKVGEFGWGEQTHLWRKLIFEVEVKNYDDITLDPVEHQNYLWATEEEIRADQVGDVKLSWINADNKEMNLQAFRLKKEGEAGKEVRL